MSEKLLSNGIDLATGEYLFPETSVAELAEVARGRTFTDGAKKRNEIGRHRARHLVLGNDGDSNELKEAGWALVLPKAASQERRAELKGALAPLIELRCAQAGEHYKELTCSKTWTAEQFLTEYKAGPGAANPKNVPYYLLLVASPEEISFQVQYELNIQYAVGRVHFDAIESYRSYAKNVVDAADIEREDPPTAAFFAIDRDPATHRCVEQLISPLIQHVEGFEPASWQVRRRVGEAATKANLDRLLGGDDTPWLLFTASHGLGTTRQDDESAEVAERRQREQNGALLCQDWPGLGTAPTSEHLFAAGDIGDDADLSGMVCFHFACFGAGTPARNSFHSYEQFMPLERRLGPRLTARPFLASLPTRMLEQGALCVIGHVDRAWSKSFRLRDNRGDSFTYTDDFKSVLSRLLVGRRVGRTMEYLGLQGAVLGSRLAGMQGNIGNLMAEQPGDGKWAHAWLCWQNARNYILLGDPAVRLPVHGSEIAYSQAAVTEPRIDPDSQESELGAGLDIAAGREAQILSDERGLEGAAQVPPATRTPEQLGELERAIGAILAGASSAQEARRLNVSETDLQRWVRAYREAGMRALRRMR